MSRMMSWFRRRKRKFPFAGDIRNPYRHKKAADEEQELPDLDLDLDDEADTPDFPPFPPSWMGRTMPHSAFFHGDTLPLQRLPDVRMDWYEDPAVCVLEVELPGVKREQIQLHVEDELLLIEADLPVRQQSYRRHYLTSERQTGHLSHPVTLHNIRREGITASLQDGVLTITMPRKEPDTVPDSYDIEIK